MLDALSAIAHGSPARSINCRMSESDRCRCGSEDSTFTCVARNPRRTTFSAEIFQPGTGSRRRCASISARLHPASTSAPRVMSPLIPEKQSK